MSPAKWHAIKYKGGEYRERWLWAHSKMWLHNIKNKFNFEISFTLVCDVAYYVLNVCGCVCSVCPMEIKISCRWHKRVPFGRSAFTMLYTVYGRKSTFYVKLFNLQVICFTTLQSLVNGYDGEHIFPLLEANTTFFCHLHKVVGVYIVLYVLLY